MEENIRKKGSSGKKSWEKQLRFTVKHYSEVKCISKKKIETSRVKGNAKRESRKKQNTRETKEKKLQMQREDGRRKRGAKPSKGLHEALLT